MQALFLQNKQLSLIESHQQPTLARGEALIRVTLAGICSTDLELVKGYYPFDGVLGHEFVGIVEAVASESDADWVGKRVVGEINISPACGGDCGRRCPQHCPQRVVLGIVDKDGAFANYLSLPTVNLLPVPENVSDEQAVFSEPLAAAVRITEQIAVADQRCAVVGPGRLGLLVAQVLRHAGAQVLVIGRSRQSLELPSAMGFVTAFSDGPPLAECDIVVETTGNPAGFALAVGLTKPNGTIVMKSTYAADAGFASIAPLMSQIVVNEIQLLGSRCGPFAPALALLQTGAVDVQSMISAEYRLSDGLAAFEHAAQRGVRKVLLRPSA